MKDMSPYLGTVLFQSVLGLYQSNQNKGCETFCVLYPSNQVELLEPETYFKHKASATVHVFKYENCHFEFHFTCSNGNSQKNRKYMNSQI